MRETVSTVEAGFGLEGEAEPGVAGGAVGGEDAEDGGEVADRIEPLADIRAKALVRRTLGDTTEAADVLERLIDALRQLDDQDEATPGGTAVKAAPRHDADGRVRWRPACRAFPKERKVGNVGRVGIEPTHLRL